MLKRDCYFDVYVLTFFRLQDENDKLVGKYTIHSQQLQSEIINLPNTVEVSKGLSSEILCLLLRFNLGIARSRFKRTSGVNN